jgi:arylsulfatase A-like enzyme
LKIAAGPRNASLGAALSVLWTAWAAFHVAEILSANRYLEFGFTYLAALTARELVIEALPRLILGVPIAVLVMRLARSPRGLAQLLPACGMLILVWAFHPSINSFLRPLVPARSPRGLVIGFLAVAAAAAGAAMGRRLAVRSRAWPFDLLAGEITVWARTIRRLPPLRHAFRRWLAPAVVALALASLIVPVVLAPATPQGPSIVVILIDTLRADHLGCYGYERLTSPNIDRLAAGATLFENAIAQGSWTKPSVASIFTSLFPSVHATGSGTRLRRKVDGDRLVMVPAGDDAPATTGQLPMAVFTMAEAFREARYRTVGLVANSLVGPEDGYGQGFERYTTIDDVGLTAEARRWIASQGERPFLLYLHYMAPHAPYEPPREFDRFRRTGSSFQIHNSATKDSINFTRTLRPSDDDLRSLVDRYDGEILRADALVGEILTTLADVKRLDRTIIVVTSDHGEEFMEHGMVWHESIHLYEELVRVPLIASVPGARAGLRVSAPVMLIDLAPTLLDLALVPVPEEMQGRSFAPAFSAEAIEPQRTFVESLDWGHLAAVRDDSLKLIYNREAPSIELYDLRRDPRERNDLSKSREGARTGLVSALARRAELNREHGGRIPLEMSALREDQKERLRSLGYIQ